MMQLPGNRVSSSFGQKWMHSKELKTDRGSKIASAIRSVFAFRVTIIFQICDPLYENVTYRAKKVLTYGYSLVEETFLFLKRPLV